MNDDVEKPKAVKGGKREGSGRKPLDSDDSTAMMAFRVTRKLKDEITNRGGSEWLRQVVTRAIQENW